MRFVALLVVALVALAIFVSCSDDKPPISGGCTENCTPALSNGGAGEGDGGSCGFVVLEDTCNDCIRTHCCELDHTCFASTSCTGLVDCIDGCAPGDLTCEQSCGSANDAGADDYGNFVSCIDESCNAECIATD